MVQTAEKTFKARFVAKGFSQINEIDYQETFAPTARVTCIRMHMQVAVNDNLILHQMDVKAAYLNSDIDCEIYLEQPEGYGKCSKNNDK